uniref:Uncharacterized protein n=1 Tax=Tetraselmis chuii TaxID=63592 RepID=A0A7S1SIK9_9CHLO|mmetsp:Transcript_14396/g.25432  ORF Transcript_14396/g.25432 Transcript_14396/m.25432 type:complete len:266 (+) Transcript_14396:208-1005(+)
MVRINASLRSIRCICFPPVGEVVQAEDELHRNLLAVGGDDGGLMLWDIRDPFQPLNEVIALRWISTTAATWVRGLQFLFASEDGSLGLVDAINRQTPGLHRFQASLWHRPGPAPLLSCHLTHGLAHSRWMAFSGEDGRVFVAKYRLNLAKKTKKTEAYNVLLVCGGLSTDGSTLSLRRPEHLTPEASLPPSTAHMPCEEQLPVHFPDEEVAIPIVRWCPVARGSCRGGSESEERGGLRSQSLYFLASGSGAGLLQLQLLRLPLFE